jgi:hypothetical protein
MKTEYSCEQCKAQLFDFVDGNLPPLEQQIVDQHLQHCESCSSELGSIWNLQSRVSHWSDERVPRWNKKQFFFEPSPWPMRMQWATSFASVFVLILVLTEARISTVDGLTVDFAGKNARYVSQTELTEQITQVQLQQQADLDTSVQKLNSQQITTNQLLLRTVLDTSRQERREDLGNMFVLWEEAQDQRAMSTEESLRYLIASQVQDRREIRDLNEALETNNRNF